MKQKLKPLQIFGRKVFAWDLILITIFVLLNTWVFNGFLPFADPPTVDVHDLSDVRAGKHSHLGRDASRSRGPSAEEDASAAARRPRVAASIAGVVAVGSRMLSTVVVVDDDDAAGSGRPGGVAAATGAISASDNNNNNAGDVNFGQGRFLVRWRWRTAMLKVGRSRRVRRCV